MAGDAVIGRKTLPMLLPRALARWGIGILLLTWSTILVAFWDLPAGAALVLYGLAGYTACSFVKSNSQDKDHEACWWYNVSNKQYRLRLRARLTTAQMWFTACLALPLFHRLRPVI